MKSIWANRRKNRGFTLPEVLLTVAILVVLFALAAIPVTRMQRELRQTELDSKAEILFQSAQNRMTQLTAAGTGSKYQLGVTQLRELPVDAEEDNYDTADIPLYYVTDAGKDDPNSAAYYILPQDGTENELWSNHWVVEFDKQSGSVYAVFYSEDDLSAYPDGFQLLRDRTRRVRTAKVGYYGGDSVAINDTGILNPTVRINNGEKLEIEVNCTAPNSGRLTFQVTLRDSEGHTAGPIVFSDAEVERSGYMDYTATMVLDDLSGDGSMRFARQSRLAGLTPGSNLTVTVDVTSEDTLVEPASWRGETNGLFETVRGGDTAVITCARHLQNLDEASEVTDEIVAAVQEQNIDFTGAESWSTVYGAMKFKPIENANLTSYRSYVETEGTVVYPVIAHLPVETTGNAGLFESLRDATLEHVSLTGAQIRGGQYAGGLVGTALGKLTITDCRVSLDPRSDSLSTKDETYVWIDGGTVGGLVGYIRSAADVTVTNSFAATVLRGSAAAGGLFGAVDSGAASVENSYADCYLYSDTQTGGLVGQSIGTSMIRFASCYSAGFQKAPVTAGISAGPIVSMTSCYSASVPLESGRLTYSTSVPYDAGSPFRTTAVRTFYLAEQASGANLIAGTVGVSYREWSGANRAAAAQRLGGNFTAVTTAGSTVAYNLMDGMGLSIYSYPKLQGVAHYGDWKAEFESGSLAYYEKYGAADYGFLGGNVSSLSSVKMAVGDGYGMIYDVKPIEDIAVTYLGSDGTEQSAVIRADSAVSVYYDGEERYLLPLPKEVVNAGYASAADFYQKIVIGTETYFYNPHFACTVTTAAEDGTTEKPESVVIRTARQLYNLSLYYEVYASAIKTETVFVQQSDIDYGVYDWKNYTLVGSAMPARQMPIGSREDAPFRHTYNGSGRTIEDAPISGSDLGGEELSVYAGLFGRSRGVLQNIVLLSGEKNDTVIGFDKGIQHKTAYVGTVVGYNEGRVYNCAAAGYRVKVLANSGSTVYAGGFAGYNDNDGRVDRCSVSIPSLYAESVFAQLNVGGFLGGNEGRVDRSYGIGAVNVPTIRGGGAVLGGFAAANGGIIRSAYCATAMSSAGAETDGFTSSGSVRGCYYLNDGTYSFLGKDRLYKSTTRSGAAPVTAAGLEELTLSGFGEAVRTEHNTENIGKLYPYPAGVQDADGAFVHYGDWPVPADIGELGVYYWELEEGEANGGYHISYIGFIGTERREGDSLCTAHDDDDTVTAYGYGYYWKNGTTQPTLSAGTAFARSGAELAGRTDAADKASEAFAALIPGYQFVSYETGESGLRLQSANDANGTWTLRQGGTGARSYAYTLCPFFADAFTYASDGTPGSEAVPYQVRSVAQLQFINWSWYNGTGSTSRMVESAVYTGSYNQIGYTHSKEYKNFPYLQYATVTWQGSQSESAALANRPKLYWSQTHDLNGADPENPEDGTKNTLFYPIAGAANKADAESYNTLLYNWFGGSYDGQNYYIKNIAIDSKCYNVGLFGTTVGATIKNIVLYSDNGGVIRRSTTYQDNRCAYALGGLVGIAYEYKTNLDNKTARPITNCSIAGYTVIDDSKNRQQLGEAVVGGLIGVSNVDLNKCSAVVDIEINCTHRNGTASNSALNVSKWGNFVRVGGLSGGVRYAVTNCYTGGSIRVGTETLRERVEYGDTTNTKLLDATTLQFSSESTMFKMLTNDVNDEATYIFIGGIGGSGFSSNFANFSGKNGSDDGSPTYENCYTYMSFPKLQGTIEAISIIGGVADRLGRAEAGITIKNCYYLESIAHIDFSNALKARGQNNRNGGTVSLASIYGTSAAPTAAQQKARESMLNGELSDLKKNLWGSGNPSYNLSGGTIPRTYEEMSNRFSADNFQTLLGDGFGWVTIEEVGASIHGKYSFPGKNKDVLEGQDYPFPTVLTQKSNHTDGEVNLHYGDWPTAGPIWERSQVTIDRIADYDAASGKAAVQVKLRLQNVTGASLADVALAVTGNGRFVVEIAGTELVEETTAGGEKDSYLLVTLTGLKNGSAELTATLHDTYVARLTVSVAAKLNIALHDLSELTVGASQPLELKAANSRNEELSEGVEWTVVSADPAIAAVVEKRGVPQSVEGVSAGETTLLVTLRYKLDANTTIETSRIVPVTVRDPSAGGE